MTKKYENNCVKSLKKPICCHQFICCYHPQPVYNQHIISLVTIKQQILSKIYLIYKSHGTGTWGILKANFSLHSLLLNLEVSEIIRIFAAEINKTNKKITRGQNDVF